MSGSKDDRRVEIVDTDGLALVILVYPDGKVRVQNPLRQPPQWVAEVLRRLVIEMEKG